MATLDSEYRTIFVCPYYKNEEVCPREAPTLYADNNISIMPVECNKSPVINKNDGSSVCILKLELDNENINDGIAHLGDYLEFRKMEE